MSHGKAVANGRPSELIAEHAGREAVEVYGPPARLPRSRREARAGGLQHPPHRHLGRGAAPRRRATAARPTASAGPANLEDVFVLLTGEEIA